MIKQLARCIGQYKRESILCPAFVTIEVIMDVLIPFLMARMIDEGFSGGSVEAILKTAILPLIACVLSLAAGTISGFYCSRAGAGLAKNLRLALFAKIQDFSFSNIDKFSPSSLVTRLTTDVTNLQNSYQMIIRMCARAPLMIVFAVIMTFSINASLAWIFIAAMPILALGLGLVIRNAFPIFNRVFRVYDRLNRVVQENIRGIRVVKSFVREDFEVEKFKGPSGEIHDGFVKAEKLLAFNSPLMQFSMYGCTLLVSWFGAQQIVSGSFTTGQLTSLIAYSIQILVSLMLISMAFVTITVSKTSAMRITEVLSEASDMPVKDDAVTELDSGDVRFENVSFGCLRDITLDIKSGQTIGVLGGTGSGKSSLVQLIPRLYDVTGGSVSVGGVDVRDYDLRTLRDNVAMVLQKNELFSGTIAENLRWGNKQATDGELRHACRLAQAEEFIESFPDGYETLIEQGGTNVSGGQKQRLCIARALLKQPKILILDDSTSAVDTRTDALIRKAFREEIPDTTKIIIAQRVSSVKDADQIVVLDDGGIAAVGTHTELLSSSAIYREVYESQQKGGLEDVVA